MQSSDTPRFTLIAGGQEAGPEQIMLDRIQDVLQNEELTPDKQLFDVAMNTSYLLRARDSEAGFYPPTVADQDGNSRATISPERHALSGLVALSEANRITKIAERRRLGVDRKITQQAAAFLSRIAL